MVAVTSRRLLLVTVPVATALHLLSSRSCSSSRSASPSPTCGSTRQLRQPAALVTGPSCRRGQLIGSSPVALALRADGGAALLAVMSPSDALGFDAASYLISALLLLSVRGRSPAAPEQDTKGSAR